MNGRVSSLLGKIITDLDTIGIAISLVHEKWPLEAIAFWIGIVILLTRLIQGLVHLHQGAFGKVTTLHKKRQLHRISRKKCVFLILLVGIVISSTKRR